MVRLTLFIITLILATGAGEPSGPWLVTIAVLSGLTMLGQREHHATSIGVFVISLLLLTHTIDEHRGWLIAMAVLAGLGLLLRRAERVERLRRVRRRWREWSGSERWWWDWD